MIPAGGESCRPCSFDLVRPDGVQARPPGRPGLPAHRGGPPGLPGRLQAAAEVRRQAADTAPRTRCASTSSPTSARWSSPGALRGIDRLRDNSQRRCAASQWSRYAGWSITGPSHPARSGQVAVRRSTTSRGRGHAGRASRCARGPRRRLLDRGWSERAMRCPSRGGSLHRSRVLLCGSAEAPLGHPDADRDVARGQPDRAAGTSSCLRAGIIWLRQVDEHGERHGCRRLPRRGLDLGADQPGAAAGRDHEPSSAPRSPGGSPLLRRPARAEPPGHPHLTFGSCDDLAPWRWCGVQLIISTATMALTSTHRRCSARSCCRRLRRAGHPSRTR